MSLHRYDAKRDANEPAIVSMLEALGCVVWRVSGKGLPDLIVLRAGKKWLADVKAAKKGVTRPQADLWEEAATKARCAVFILRTPEDAAAMLNNALQPWEPENCVNQQPRSEASRKHLAQIAKSAQETVRRLPKGAIHSAPYTPPRSTPVDAAKEAEVTFASADDGHKPCAHAGCTKRVLGSDTCMEHDPV